MVLVPTPPGRRVLVPVFGAAHLFRHCVADDEDAGHSCNLRPPVLNWRPTGANLARRLKTSELAPHHPEHCPIGTALGGTMKGLSSRSATIIAFVNLATAIIGLAAALMILAAAL